MSTSLFSSLFVWTFQFERKKLSTTEVIWNMWQPLLVPLALVIIIFLFHSWLFVSFFLLIWCFVFDFVFYFDFDYWYSIFDLWNKEPRKKFLFRANITISFSSFYLSQKRILLDPRIACGHWRRINWFIGGWIKWVIVFRTK